MFERRPIHDLFELMRNIDFQEYVPKIAEIKQIVQRYDEYFKKKNYYDSFYDSWSYGSSSFEFQDCNYRNETEPEIRKILLETKNKEDLTEFARLVLFTFDFILRHSDEYYKHHSESKGIVELDENLNMYKNPEIILGHTFEKMKLEEIAKTEVSQFCKDIKSYYEKCSEILARAIAPTTDNFLRKDGKMNVDLFDSLDLFLALNFTYWLMIYDPENVWLYLDALRKFLKDFLNNYPTPRNINPYLKGKFGVVIEDEMNNTYLTYPKEYDYRIQNITGKKYSTQINDLVNLLKETKDSSLKVEIVIKLASLENLFLNKNMDFKDSNLEMSFISLLLDVEERVVDYAKNILKNASKLDNESQRRIIELLKTEKPAIQEIIREITENKQISFEGDEEKIIHLVTNKKFDEISKYNSNDFLMKLLKDEFEKYEQENQRKLKEDQYSRLDFSGQLEILDSFKIFQHPNVVNFLFEIIKKDNALLKKKAIDVLGEIDSDESNSILLDIFRNGVENDTSLYGVMIDYSSKKYRTNDSQILAVLALAFNKNSVAKNDFLTILNSPEKINNFQTHSKFELLKKFYEQKRLLGLCFDERSGGSNFNAITMGLLSYQEKECTEKIINFIPKAEEYDKAEILKNLNGLIEEDRLIDLLDKNLPTEPIKSGVRDTCLRILTTLNSKRAIQLILGLLENHTEMFRLISRDDNIYNHEEMDREKLSKKIREFVEVFEKNPELNKKLQEEFFSYVSKERNYLTDDGSGAIMLLSRRIRKRGFSINVGKLNVLLEEITTEKIKKDVKSLALLAMIYASYSGYSHYKIKRHIEQKLVDFPVLKKIFTSFQNFSRVRRTIIQQLEERLSNKNDTIPEEYIEALFRLSDDYNFQIQEHAISTLGMIQNPKYYSRIADKLIEKIFLKDKTSSYIHVNAHISLIKLFKPPEERYYIDYTKDEIQKQEIVTIDGQTLTIENLWDCENEEKFRETVSKLVEWKLNSSEITI